MALTPSTTLVHLPFAAREAYGAPYPEGIAVGHIDQTGDATGGAITASFLAQDQFLYRLELLNVSSSDATVNDVSFLSVHAWATEASGFSAGAFSLNWKTRQDLLGGFSIFTPVIDTLEAVRRFPMGSVTPAAGQFVIVITTENNINNIVWDYDVVCSYWPKTALYRPGFLSSYWEAPEVAPPA